MGFIHADMADIELNSGTIHRSFVQKIIGKGDIKANRYGIRLWRNGNPESIGGSTCMGYFIRHGNGDTVTINGGLFNGQEAYVDLPEACYAYDGTFTLVIKLVGSGITGTMRIVDGTIVDSMLGDMIDPGSVVPDLDDLLAVISRAEDAANVVDGLTITSEQIAGTRYGIAITQS